MSDPQPRTYVSQSLPPTPRRSFRCPAIVPRAVTRLAADHPSVIGVLLFLLLSPSVSFAANCDMISRSATASVVKVKVKAGILAVALLT